MKTPVTMTPEQFEKFRKRAKERGIGVVFIKKSATYDSQEEEKDDKQEREDRIQKKESMYEVISKAVKRSFTWIKELFNQK